MSAMTQNLADKRVLVRVDFNLPLEDGHVQDDTRIRDATETIQRLLQANAKIILLSHISDESNGSNVGSFRPIIPTIEKVLNKKIVFIPSLDSADAVIEMAPAGSIILLDNLRLYPGEEQCDISFAKRLAQLGDFYINEAFSASHRNHASLVHLPRMLPHALGIAFRREITIIDQFLHHGSSPKMAIVGGKKLSTKVYLLKKLITKVDKLALGGGIAGAFLSFFGNTNFSVFEQKDYVEEVINIINTAKSCGCKLIIPVDFSALVSNSDHMDHAIISSDNRCASIFDIGPESVKLFMQHIDESRMVLWNGPVGLFEKTPFNFGTEQLALHIAQATREKRIESIVGGGDTVYAMNRFGVANDITHLSTGGGAFLTYIQDESLPGLSAVLEDETRIF